MYLDEAESVRTASALTSNLKLSSGVMCAVFPNTLAFASVREVLQEGEIGIGAQNVSWVPRGAYTGATSAELFFSAGATYALVGHSERRYIFHETDTDVRKKVEACIDAGIIPVICIGETEEDRQTDKVEYRIKKQLMKVFENLPITSLPMIVAYEPVWAIGTGNACSEEEAVRMVTLIKTEIATHYTGTVSVLYGGSVDEKNAASYLAHGVIDGLLIGSASTDATRFTSIIEQSTF